MTGPILETKLHVPRRRRSVVSRPALTARLDSGAEATLTLVSAPAGFGKTTLLADWLTVAPTDRRAVAWLSLDRRDNDPAVFWRYLVEALERAAPGVGVRAVALLGSPQSSRDEVLATLLNDLQAVPDDVVLVLDDYHVVESHDVHEGMAFLIDHLPRHVHLVIAGRADPALPLGGLRGRGDLVEVRAADLRFTAGEAASYLTEVMGLALTADDVAALESRTEGWIAALQLAALSMQGRADARDFITGFAGDDRYIVDYLVEEVLQRLPDDVRDFLLETSILSRLTGPLVDAVTGQVGGRGRLEELDRANLFLVPLDDRRRWYRYHHLFADVLHARLLDEQPDRVRELHARASGWYEHAGDLPEAIRHATAAADHERAADLVERAVPATRQARQETTLRRWLEAVPDDVLADRPLLSLVFAGTLLQHGEPAGVETHPRVAERWLEALDAGHVARADAGADVTGPAADVVRSVRGGVALYRAALASLGGDVTGAIAHAGSVLEVTGPQDAAERGSAAGLLGLAYWASGDLASSHRWWSESVANLERAGLYADTLGCSIALADIRITQGRLRDAIGTYERALQVATAHGSPLLRGAADMHVGLSGVLRERGELDAARHHLATSSALGDHLGLPQNPYRSRVATARLRLAEGDALGALPLLDEAERLYAGDMFPEVQPVAAWRARAWVAAGRLDAAVAWVRDRGLTVDDDLVYLRELEHVTLARVLLAQHAAGDAEPAGSRGGPAAESPLNAAVRLLERLLRSAEEGDRVGTVLEVLVLQALAHQAQDDGAAALGSLGRALALAQPEGYVRVFADEGPPMAALLRAAVRAGVAPEYTRRVLGATTQASDVVGPAAQPGLVEPLSARELEVLRLLATDLDGPDIARRLVVSLNTVRTHTKNIYAKLGVNSRRAAVRRSHELGLVPPAG
ncbi:LuxR C-terminal-related transcriptional regulator [Cellulomonas fimi]|uniref:Helix-turn-helix transcriptional regulator n=1 Tax=Cellulomonas fimi TaxID=1708 RepID=A0A7Y0QI52_CELFI|nr:LuxR C-terminal-related transcriptional regulator [Cellulomonas fimi]NMR20970.1 helix-turn-helix transcriptional regulator [Cellulomonas fimi]